MKEIETLPALTAAPLPADTEPAGVSTETIPEDTPCDSTDYPSVQPAGEGDPEAAPAVAEEAPATVAHCSGEEVQTADPQSAEEYTGGTPSAADKVATATPDGALTVSIPIGGDDRYIPADRVDLLVEEAYLKGRNEAVRMQIAADSSIPLRENGAPRIADDLADLFLTRPSVWDTPAE